MADNVIWGTDFKAKLADLWDSMPQPPAVMPATQAFVDALSEFNGVTGCKHWADTAPSEYVSPSDDCA